LKKDLYGNDNVEAAGALNNLGFVLVNHGRLDEGAALLVEALELRRKTLQGCHPDLAFALANVAGLLNNQKKWSEAEAMGREALAMQRKLFNGDHPRLATTLWNVGVALAEMGQFAEAEARLLEALAMRRRLVDGDGPELTTILHELARVQERLGKLAEAEGMYSEALETSRRLHGEVHPAVADLLNRLAVVLREQHKLGEAESAAVQALETCRRLFHQDHPDTAAALNVLALVLSDQGKLEEARILAAEELEMQIRMNGRENSAVAESLDNLALIMLKLGKPAEAEAMHRESLELLRNLQDAAGIAKTLHSLAHVFLAQSRYSDAEDAFREGIEIQRRISEAETLVKPLRCLSGTLHAQGKTEDAIAAARESLELAYASFGQEHRAVVFSLWTLGRLVDERGDMADSERLLRQALEMGRKLLNAADPDLTLLLIRTAPVLLKAGALEEAEALAREANLAPGLPGFEIAPLLIELDDGSRYRSFQRRTLLRFRAAEDPLTAAGTAISLLLGHVPQYILEIAIRQADRALEAGADELRLPYFEFAKALAEYRTGEWARAMEWAKRSLSRSSVEPATSVSAGAVLSMAQQQLERHEEASTSLEVASKMLRLPGTGNGDWGDDWSSWLTARILLREAAALVHADSKLGQASEGEHVR
jgi:tetratricopeptide (TPR) repeat protein